MIEAVIFDMDGVLVDSEPLWQEAEMEVFESVGLHLTRAQCIETTGLPVHDAVSYRFKSNPWNGKSIEQVCEEIVQNVIKRIRERAVPSEGAIDILNFFESLNIPMALASSSPASLISTVLEKLSIQKYFRAVHSAENEEYGKPHPAVFISTAGLLNVKPVSCLVFEDSFNGLIAAKAARMKAVVIPMGLQRDEERFNFADLKLKSLSEFSALHWKNLNK